MKCSESWLREWVNPKETREELSHTLTMGGLEVDELAPVAAEFSGIIVGEVLTVEKHPEAERLHICEVNVNQSMPLQIVCGASNVRAGMKAPVAMINAVLPNNTIIKETKLRGITSYGMLCSAVELGLAEESTGLLELSPDAPIAKDVRQYLKLDDYTFDVAITPNRGDCMSVRGLAREVGALTHTALTPLKIAAVAGTNSDVLPVTVTEKSACPVYMGRIIRNVKADAMTPTWLKERLRRSGVRSISPIVDVTNYVMLELGQPMHAFDLDKIKQSVHVRNSKRGEKITLLDGSEKELDDATLVIADAQQPLAIAGVMGGMDSGVSLLTNNIFLESAFFASKTVARQRQFYHLNSDSASRFERGVDPTIQQEAIERATKLIIEIADGEAGPVIEVVNNNDVPKTSTVTLACEKIEKVLGVAIAENEIEKIFTSLHFAFKKEKNHWRVEVPPYRFDITLPEDLIEEIARVHGYDHIPTHALTGKLEAEALEASDPDLSIYRETMRDLGYQEIVSYSFIDKATQRLLDPEQVPRELVNPITADMTVMRTNLWPGLLKALSYNASRQQERIRLFEFGKVFLTRGDALLQVPRLSGLIMGAVNQEQWGEKSRAVDFYDLKGDLVNLLALNFAAADLEFKKATHPALHPGQTAAIYYQQEKIGLIGALHPSIAQSLDLTEKVFLFEFDVTKLLHQHPPKQYQELSKFPEIRRDIAILVNQTIPAADIQDTITCNAGDWLKNVFIFDVYQGKGVPSGLKSIALGLVLQHPTRTLVDAEVSEIIERVVTALKGTLGAELRS